VSFVTGGEALAGEPRVELFSLMAGEALPLFEIKYQNKTAWQRALASPSSWYSPILSLIRVKSNCGTSLICSRPYPEGDINERLPDPFITKLPTGIAEQHIEVGMIPLAPFFCARTAGSNTLPTSRESPGSRQTSEEGRVK